MRHVSLMHINFFLQSIIILPNLNKSAFCILEQILRMFLHLVQLAHVHLHY